MKKHIKISFSFIVTSIIVLLHFSCDQDFADINSDILGAQNFNSNSLKFPVTAYNKATTPVQTSALNSNVLGMYKDPIYGTTTANIVTQITPRTYNPDFGDEPEIESVMLYIPYYVTNEGDDGEGGTLYSLDSLLYGATNPMKIGIYRTNYFLRDVDPENIEEPQKYYSNANQIINFDNRIIDTLYLNDPAVNQQNGFIPSAAEITITEQDEETQEQEIVERLSPGIHVSLNYSGNEFWENLLFFNDIEDIDHPELSNSNNFKNYFRGLYLKIEPYLDQGTMIMLNMDKAVLTVNYSNLQQTTELDENDNYIIERTNETYEFTFAGNRINLFKNDATNTVIETADANANTTDGDENLYLKGGEGSMAVVNLFEGTVFDEETQTNVPSLEYFKSKKDTWVINEANLVFYVNQETNLEADKEPERVLLYDLRNNTPLVDLYTFGIANTATAENSYVYHAPPLERDESTDKGIKYKIRLTEHINNILYKDSTNLKLGLMVTSNINELQRASIKNATNNSLLQNITTGTVLSPRGTILYGSNAAVNEEKRVQLEIFYTKSN